MAFCTQCGNSLPSGTKFCTSCGAAQASGEVTAPKPQPAPQPIPQPVPQLPPQPAPQHYAYPYAAPQPYLEEPISTGSYIGIFLLLMIPFVNILCVLLWACGGCSKRNLTYLSRAMLFWMLICMVLGALFSLAAGMLLGEHLQGMQDALNELNKLGEQYQQQP